MGSELKELLEQVPFTDRDEDAPIKVQYMNTYLIMPLDEKGAEAIFSPPGKEQACKHNSWKYNGRRRSCKRTKET